MRAVRIDGQTPGGKRTRLADVLPLATPFSVQIFPVYGCNLACAYCIHSVPPAERGFVAGKVMLDYALYEKCIDGLAEFPRRLKMLRRGQRPLDAALCRHGRAAAPSAHCGHGCLCGRA